VAPRCLNLVSVLFCSLLPKLPLGNLGGDERPQLWTLHAKSDKLQEPFQSARGCLV